MGCKNTKEKEQNQQQPQQDSGGNKDADTAAGGGAAGGAAGGAGAKTPPPPAEKKPSAPEPNIHAFIAVTLTEYCHWLSHFHIEAKNELLLAVANTCAHQMVEKFEILPDHAVEECTAAIHAAHTKLHLPHHATISPDCSDATHQIMIESYWRVYKSIRTRFSTLEPLEFTEGEAIDALKRVGVKHSGGCLKFSELCERVYKWYRNDAITSVYREYSSHHTVLTPDQFREFLARAQYKTNVKTVEVAKNVIDTMFGGVVTPITFSMYFGRHSTNSVLDQQRVGTVWQDMTLPLPHYSILTRSVSTNADIADALRKNTRAFLLSCVVFEGTVYIGDDLALDEFLVKLKSVAFKRNPFPIIIGFTNPHTIAEQERIKATLTRYLPAKQLAHGLMFRGCGLNDPQFTPAALQSKYLILAPQAQVRPFVGFRVSDMHRALGVKVTEVQTATAAAKGGIARDDWLTHINGIQINDKKHLRECLDELHLGDEVSLRKENLADVRMAVNGAIGADDKSHSKNFSDVVYLKYVADEEQDENREYAPWETHHIDCKTLSPPRKMRLRKQSPDHFLMVKGNVTDDGSQVSIAEHIGVQLIDTGPSDARYVWACGRYADNAACGYIIKQSDQSVNHFSAFRVLYLKVLSSPTGLPLGTLVRCRTGVFGGQLKEVEGDSFEIEVTDDHTVFVIEVEFDVTPTAAAAALTPLIFSPSVNTPMAGLTPGITPTNGNPTKQGGGAVSPYPDGSPKCEGSPHLGAPTSYKAVCSVMGHLLRAGYHAMQVCLVKTCSNDVTAPSIRTDEETVMFVRVSKQPIKD